MGEGVSGKNEKMVTTVHDTSQLMRSCFLSTENIYTESNWLKNNVRGGLKGGVVGDKTYKTSIISLLFHLS